MKKVDQWSGIVLLIIAVLICWGAGTLPYGNIHNPGPGFFPLWLGIILGVLSIGLIVKTTTQKENVGYVKEFLSEKIRWVKVFFVIIALILYGILIDYLGFLIITFLFMAFLLRFVGLQSWKTVIGWALIGSIGCYLIFEVLIKLRLPKGFLGV